MTGTLWQVTFQIYRKKNGEKLHYDAFTIDVDPDEYVLDAIERIWAFHDRTLIFRHACHHSTCGACGMRVNGREKLTCITSIRSVARNGGTVIIEPLRNFPVVSDLVVDMGDLFLKMARPEFDSVAQVEDAGLPYEKSDQDSPTEGEHIERLVDCIECGLCISACPSSTTDEEYVGPAVLAAIHLMYQQNPSGDLIEMADHHTGLWRCHSAYECTAVCPSAVDPAWRIMDMRKKVIGNRLKSLFTRKVEKESHD